MTIVKVDHDKLAAETKVHTPDVQSFERYGQSKKMEALGKSFARKFAPRNQDYREWWSSWKNNPHPALKGLTPNEAVVKGDGKMVIHIIDLNLSPSKKFSGN